MVGMVEIELDKETGAVKILDYQAVVDCGIPVNPNLARVQTEGGIGQESAWHFMRMSPTMPVVK